MACDVRDIHYVGTFRMNTFGNSRVPQKVTFLNPTMPGSSYIS